MFGLTAPVAAAGLLLLPLIVTAGGEQATAAARDVVADSEARCPDVLILGARGSGEAPRGIDPADYTGPDRGLGATLPSFAGPLETQLKAQGLVVRTEGVVYDAAAVWSTDIADVRSYIDTIAGSARQGAGQIMGKIRDLRRNGCEPQTSVVLAGYSQGAWAVRRSFFLLTREERASISSIVLFGDPLYNSDERQILDWYVPLSRSILGVARVLDGKRLPGGGRLELDPRLEGALSGQVARSYCLPRDAVCRARPGSGLDAHARYPDEATSVAATWVAGRLATKVSGFPRLATAQPVAATPDGRVDVTLNSDRGLAPVTWTFEGTGPLTARGVTLTSDGHLSGLLTLACPAGGCAQDVVITAADGRAVRVTVTVTGGRTATPPWTRAIVGPDATVTDGPVVPDEPALCPTTPYAVEPATRAVVQGVAETFLSGLVSDAQTFVSVLETLDPNKPVPASVTENPLYGQAMDMVVDLNSNQVIETPEVVAALREFIVALQGDAAVTDTVDQLANAAGKIPAGVDPATFVGHYDPVVPPAPQLEPTCVAVQPTAGSRLWHYGLYRDLGWFVDLPPVDLPSEGTTGSRFVQLTDLPSLADTVVVPVTGAQVPTWVVMHSTSNRWNSPLSLLTIGSTPVDTCPDSSGSPIFDAIAKRLQHDGLNLIFEDKKVPIRGVLIANIVEAALNTPKACWEAKASLTPITAPDGHRIGASDQSFTITPDGRHLAVTEDRSMTNIYGDPYQVQVVERFELTGAEAVTERQVMLGGPPAHGYFATVGLSLSPDGRYLSTCNAGVSPSTYDAVTDTVTYPQNVPWRTPFPVCRILSTSNSGLVTFVGSSPDPQNLDYVLWTYQDPE